MLLKMEWTINQPERSLINAFGADIFWNTSTRVAPILRLVPRILRA